MMKPSDVFTPGRPPLDQNNVYAARGDAESDLRTALERNMFPVVFGDYGAGKTSMARHVLRKDQAEGRLVNVESVAGKSFGDIINQLLEHTGYSTTRQTSTKNTNGSSFSITASLTGKSGIPGQEAGATIGGSFRRDAGKETSELREFAVTTPSDSRVLQVCENHGLALLLDEMHHASAAFVDDLSVFLKAASNKPCKHFRTVILGTASDSSRLVNREKGIDRLIQEIELGRMTAAEAQQVVTVGMERLKIKIGEHLVDRLVALSVGSPALVQYLSLEVAEEAFRRNPRSVDDGDLERAVTNYLRKKAKRLDDEYVKAIETVGEKRYRKQILIAMATLDDDYVTMDSLVTQVSSQLDENVPSTALSGPLRKLKDDYQILKDVERQEGGARVFNYTRFADPMMKTFIRMRNTAEQSGML